VPVDGDSAARIARRVARVLARGGQQANAQAQTVQQPDDQGSFFDVWTHTGSGIQQLRQDFAADPAAALHSHYIPAQPGRIAEAMAPGQWQRSSQSEVDQSMATQASSLSKDVDAVGKAEGALATTGAVFSLLTSVEQFLSTPASFYPFPGLPAVRIGDIAVGFPHAHAHPPNIPFPSFGPVIPIPFFSGARRVLINGMPAARCGDLGIGVWCGGYFPMYEIFLGSSNVWIEGARAARIGVDITRHCVFSTPKPSDFPIGLSIGTTVSASPNVLIGGVPLPSLTSLAVFGALKVVFAGLGKAGKALRAAGKSRPFSRLGGGLRSRKQSNEARLQTGTAETEIGALKGINLDARPKGIQYSGTVYRLEDPTRVSTTFDVHAGNIAADHRYSGNGFGAVYGGTSPQTALAEVEHYGLSAGRVSASKEVSLNNVLDLTNPATRNELNVTLGQITGDSYSTTHQLGTLARTNGYDGILAPSARNPGGTNLVIFPRGP
jgi:RES domain-containing protein/uncharacterized Zn-binding protein involved in type VI secretion